MRVVYFGNKRVGLEALRWLKQEEVDVVGLVVHPPERQELGVEIIAASGLPEDRIFYGSDLGNPETLEALRGLQPDIGLSALFGYILKSDVLGLFPRGVLNIHPGLLPYNRGRNAHVWPMLDGTPAGATLHYMDLGVDTGPVVGRCEVEVEPWDTAGTLYPVVEQACVEVLKTHWPDVEAGRARAGSQEPSEGTSHRFRDLEPVAKIDLDREYTGRELINVLRALTGSPLRAAYFEEQGKKVYVTIELLPEDSEGGGD